MVNSEAPNGSTVGNNSPLPIPDILSKEKQVDDLPTSSNGHFGSESPVLTDRELTAAWIQRKNMSDEHLRTIDAINAGAISLQEAFLEIMPSFADLVPNGGFSEDMICNLLSEFFDTPPPRHKLPQYNTFQDAVNLIRKSKKIMILTGAGVSVSCGIPDFRSKDGIYARLHKDFPDLPDPTAMFDIRYFDHNPQPFYNFAKEIFMGQFEPSLSHKFIRQLELSGQLLRNYTQNIDTLEAQTGIQNVIECHGSFSKASCRLCKAKFAGEIVREDVMAQRVARCPECKEGVIKPDITFFGEDLPPAFHHAMTADKDQVDLLIVMGSSLKVGPVNAIPFSVPKNVPQILINRERLKDYEADIEILGNCDEILREISFQLGGGFEQMVRTHDEKMKCIKPDYYGYPQPRVCLDHKKFEEYMLADAKSVEMVIELGCPEEPTAKRQKITKLRYEKRFVRVGRKFPQGGFYFQTNPNVSIFFGSYATFDRDELKLCISAPRYPRLPAPKVHGCCSGGECSKSSREKTMSESSTSSSDSDANKSQRGGSEPPEIYGRVEEAPSMRAASCEPAVDVDSLIPVSDFARALEEEDDDCSSDGDSDHDLGSNYASSGGETPKYEFPDLSDQDSHDDTPAM